MMGCGKDQSKVIVLDELPTLLSVYGRAAIQRRKKPTPSTKAPDLSAHIEGLSVDAEELDAYRRICAIADDGMLPPTYPQVLATPVHAAIVADPLFPLPVLGMVHLNNRIIEHRPIEQHEVLDIECALSGWKWDERLGVRFAIDTTVRVDDEVVWQSTLWALSRGKKEELVRRDKPRGKDKNRRPGKESQEPVVSVIVDLGADLGRRYAAVCGDYNPIHLHPLLSKLFGFRKPIIHGMWTLARCWADLADRAVDRPLELTVDFKKPLYIPSTALISAIDRDDGGLDYMCRAPDGDRVYLRGQVKSHQET